MSKIISNLTKKISLELIVLFIFIFLVATGFVYASWNDAQTDLAEPINNIKWNALVNSIYNICGTSCVSSNFNAAQSTSTSALFYLTKQNWFGFVDLVKDSIKNCTCQTGTCDSQWSQALNSAGISRGSWNALVDEVYRKCVGSPCSSYYNLATIYNNKLTKGNWNNFINLASTTMINCIAGGPTCTPNCSGKVCGPDGCGGTCGNCSGSMTCNNTIGQCVDTSSSQFLSGAGTCNSFCTSIGGICQSVGTDSNGTNGQISSATTDPKSGVKSCAAVAGTCASPLGNQGILCNGYNADWTYCKCLICSSNYTQSCTNGLGDLSCVNAGTYNCNGSCIGATLKAAGTACGTNAKCNASGQCITCGANYTQSCTNGLGDLSCVNAGTYDCFGVCQGASRKAAGTVCGTNMICNSSGICEPCTPACTGKVCGPDGCGSTCGTCDSGMICVDSTGQCVVGTGHFISGSGTCNSLCTSLVSICQSVGTDPNGTNGQISSVTTDKTGVKSCAAVAGTCASVLGNQGVACNGYNADWTYCKCTPCSANYTQSCTNGLGDLSCVNAGIYDCFGVCQGATRKAAGTVCGVNAKCNASGVCVTCSANYTQSCTNGLGDASCVNAGIYDCFGVCQGATRKAAGTVCGVNAKCNASGVCVTCSANYTQSCTNGLGDASCVNAGIYDCFGVCQGATRKAAGTVCGTNMICNSSSICEPCTPACTGKVCGLDGCGSTCGTCDPGLICVDSTGQCVSLDIQFLSGAGNCNSLCTSIGGICQSVGTDPNGTNGQISSVTTDKTGVKSCAAVTGNCASTLGDQSTACNGYNADWTYCRCVH